LETLSKMYLPENWKAVWIHLYENTLERKTKDTFWRKLNNTNYFEFIPADGKLRRVQKIWKIY